MGYKWRYPTDDDVKHLDDGDHGDVYEQDRNADFSQDDGTDVGTDKDAANDDMSTNNNNE